MNKSTKGAVAAGAAAILLLGGAGTLAFWTDSESITTGPITTGELALGAAVCDDEWVYAEGNASEDEEVTFIVPGDSVSRQCEFDISAVGDNLAAELTTPTTVDIEALGAPASFEATVAATYVDQDDDPLPATITEDNDGDVVTATLTVTFPFGSDETGTPIINGNDTQNVTAVLDNLVISLVQVPAP